MTAVTKPDGRTPMMRLFTKAEARERILPHLPGRTPEDKDAEYDRLVSIIDRETRRNPDLLKCSGNSIVDAAAEIVQWHLDPGTTAYLVPFGDRCVAVPGYRGMASVLMASGAVRAVEPAGVYANDFFDIEGGTDARVVHKPVWKGARGDLIGALIVFRLKHGHTTWRYMPIEEIDAIRQKYSKAYKKGPVPEWYAIKTVMRQAWKFLAVTPELQRAFTFARMDDAELETAIAAAEETQAIEANAARALGAGEPPEQPEQQPRLTEEQRSRLVSAMPNTAPDPDDAPAGAEYQDDSSLDNFNGRG